MSVLERGIALASNGLPLSTAEQRLGRLTPTSSQKHRDELWEQYRSQAEFSEHSRDLPREDRISACNRNMKTGWLSSDLASMADTVNTRWLVADYEAGDMVVHSPYMVHLSTDIRYQRVRDEIDVRWSNHWSLDDML